MYHEKIPNEWLDHALARISFIPWQNKEDVCRLQLYLLERSLSYFKEKSQTAKKQAKQVKFTNCVYTHREK